MDWSKMTGRERDAFVNEHLLGYYWRDYTWYDGTPKQLLWHNDMGEPKGDDFGHLPDGRIFPWDMDQPTTDWAIAGEIMDEHPYHFYLTRSNETGNIHAPWSEATWRCRFYAPRQFEVIAETGPMAICLAALRAKGIQIGTEATNVRT